LIGFQSGCCALFRAAALRRIGGFDERFFYHFEETDLCFRIWKSGSSVLFDPDAEIIHLGGQSVGRFPIRFALETQRSGYRFFCKHFGVQAACHFRWIKILHYLVRWIGYGLSSLAGKDSALAGRLAMYRVLLKWNWRLDPARFLETGEEPGTGYEPLAPAPQMFPRHPSGPTHKHA
jgi:GT2 family glycosyltransferase